MKRDKADSMQLIFYVELKSVLKQNHCIPAEHMNYKYDESEIIELSHQGFYIA